MIGRSSTINGVRNQRLQLLHTLIDAWMRQSPGQHTDFVVEERDDDYAIRHPGLSSAGKDFYVPRADIDAMVETGYLNKDRREEPGFWSIRIPYRGFDVFDARLGEMAKPEFERQIVFDMAEDHGEPVQRTVDLQGHVYTLTASPRHGTGDWAARVTRYSLTAGASPFRQAVLDQRSEIHDQAAILNTMRATGETAGSALEELEARLKIAVERALQGDRPSESNGQ